MQDLLRVRVTESVEAGSFDTSVGNRVSAVDITGAPSLGSSSPVLFDKPTYNAAEPRVRVQTKGPRPYAKVFESFKAIYYSVLQNMYYPTIFMMTWKARFKFRILRLLRLPCQNMAAWGGLAPGLWIPNPYPQPVPHFSSSCQLCVPPPAIAAFCTCVGTLQPAR